MPDDTKKQPQNLSGTLPPTDDAPPVLSMEDNVPPTLQVNPSTNVGLKVEEEKLADTTKIDETSGSAAPNNDIVMPPVITTQKKKFAGGKVIATILSLFLLVGGVAAGLILVDQNQDIREKAFKDEAGYQSGEDITGGNCGPNQTQANGWFQCGSGTGGPDCTFCLKASQRTCNQVLASRQCNAGGIGSCGDIDGAVNIYYCQGENGVGSTNGTGNGCQRNDPLPGGVRWDDASNSIVGSFCGTVQVDDRDSGTVVFCSRTDTSGCNSEPEQTPPPTPNITASCQNVKAYSDTWTLLTNTQLSALKPNATINFCVTGVTTGGSFNKARFTINNVLQAETTTIRPTSTDFCQLYTIPAGTTTFNVTAQINHVTLGWK